MEVIRRRKISEMWLFNGLAYLYIIKIFDMNDKYPNIHNNISMITRSHIFKFNKYIEQSRFMLLLFVGHISSSTNIIFTIPISCTLYYNLYVNKIVLIIIQNIMKINYNSMVNYCVFQQDDGTRTNSKNYKKYIFELRNCMFQKTNANTNRKFE